MLVIPSGSTSRYNLTRSLRLRRSNNNYFTRSYAGIGDRRKWTWSAWVKRGAIDAAAQFLFIGYSSTTTRSVIYFDGNSSLGYYEQTAGAIAANITSTGVYRDASAWMHVVVLADTAQATATNRLRMFVNGVEITAFSATTYPALNQATHIANSGNHNIGCDTTAGTSHFDGLIAEMNFIDGQALTPSSFGEIDATTGVWKPKKYTGSYGTNGFYLPFTDNSALTTSSNVGLGRDYSGNGNYWVTGNISITAGATYDSFTDVPTLTSSTASNFATLNPIDNSIIATGAISYANLRHTGTAGVGKGSLATINGSSIKCYFEMSPASITTGYVAASAWTGATQAYDSNGVIYVNGSVVGSSYATWGVGDVVGVAVDRSANTIAWYKNNTLIYTSTGVQSGDIAVFIYTSGTSVVDINFGQRPFAYTPPTGFLSLNTYNLPTPTIPAGDKYMDATLYTGNGSSLSVVNAGTFQPDLVWAKSRSLANFNILVDAVRGAANYLASNSTGLEGSNSAVVSSINSNGFTLGSDTTLNTNASTGVAWQWKKSATAGFDIVTYTGNGTNRTISHSLGVAPKFLVVKDRTTAYDWIVWHSTLAGNEYLVLNTTNAKAVSANPWNSTIPTSSAFSLGVGVSTNANADNYVAYLWSEIAGFSKFDSYTGNGSTDGPFVFCGFRPRWILIKSSSLAGSQWVMWDTSRDAFNIVGSELFPNTSSAEAVGSADMDIVANGFKIRRSATNFNTSAETYIYAAFAENPFKHALAR